MVGLISEWKSLWHESDRELEIEKIIMHKDYNHGDPYSPNDIALILLKEAITFGQFQVKKYWFTVTS